MMSFACPKCQMVLRAPEERAGAVTACPRCRQSLRVPSPAQAPAHPPAPPGNGPAAVQPSVPATANPPQPAWFFLQGGKRYGPATWAQLQQLAEAGRLQPADGIWKDGMAQPALAQSYAGLFARTPPAPAAAQQPAGVPRSPVPASGAMAAVDSPAPPDKPPLWKRALLETKAIGSATLRQSVRPLFALHGWWRGRSVRKAAQASKLALGQKAYEAQIGDKDLRKQIHGLGEEIHSAEVHKKATRQLSHQRRDMLFSLAEPLLTQPAAPPAVAEAHARARAAAQEVREHQDRLAARKRTFPSGAAAWRRVGIGYGLAACVAAGVFWWFASDSSSPSEPAKPGNQQVNKPPDKKKPTPRKKAPLRDLNTEEIYAASAKSVALIRGNRSSGTGFLVRPNILATNAHVIDVTLPSALKVYFPSAGVAGKTPLSAKLLYFDSRRDLAFLEIPAKLEALVINETYKFKGGQSVTVIGNPGVEELTLENAVNQGVMSTRTKIKGQDYYQMGISVNPGNSGGPVFDAKGQVIGIVTLKAKQQEAIAFCIPAQDVVKALAAIDKTTPKARQEMAARHALVVVFQQVAAAGKTYTEGMDALVSIMRRGIPPQVVVARLKPQIDKKLKELDEFLEGIPQAINELESKADLPEDLRQQMTDLWNTCQSMKRCLANPPPNPFQLAQQSQQLGGKFKELVKELSNKLGVEASE